MWLIFAVQSTLMHYGKFAKGTVLGSWYLSTQLAN